MKMCFCEAQHQSMPFAERVKEHINYLSISISTTEKQISNNKKKKKPTKTHQPYIAKEKHSGKWVNEAIPGKIWHA